MIISLACKTVYANILYSRLIKTHFHFNEKDFDLVRITHRGGDAWYGREMHLYWTDGARTDCQDAHVGWLDNSQHKDMNCDG